MKWISVKDRLPKNNDDVIIWSCGEAMMGYFSGGWVREGETVSCVTHWMIPISPREDL